MLKYFLIVPIYILRRWGIHIFAVGLSILLLLLVHRKVYEQFHNDSRYNINLESYQVAGNPDWLIDDQLKESVNESLEYNIKVNIFDDEVVNKVKEHYEKSPWVRKVVLIQKRLPNNLKIKLELRRPYLAVIQGGRAGEYYYLVDKDSVRLPGKYSSLPALPMIIPLVSGVKNNPPLAGFAWKDKGLKSALSVASTLKKHKLLNTLQVDRIDVANLNYKQNSRKSDVLIWTKDKVRIEWGRSPDTDKFGELTVEEKVNNLRLVLDVCPELKGIKYVKIQFDEPYIALDDK